MEEARVLTADEAGELLKIPVGEIRKLARAGQIPAVQLGKRWRFDREALLQRMSKVVVKSGAEKD